MKFALYEHDKKKWPNGTSTTCLHCGSAVRVSQPAVAARSQALGTFGFHYDCLQQLAASMHEQYSENIDAKHNEIADKIAETDGDPFGFKERHGY